MPLITFDTVAGALDQETKKRLSDALTDVVVEIVGPEIKAHTWVLINEAPEGDFHVGGRALKASDYHYMMAKKEQSQ